jgi:hypothetical protein
LLAQQKKNESVSSLSKNSVSRVLFSSLLAKDTQCKRFFPGGKRDNFGNKGNHFSSKGSVFLS